MRKRSGGTPPVGGSSLLVIFAVLCLTVFALLALSTVEAGGRLSQKAATAVSDYYTADADAEEVLAQLRAGKSPKGVRQRGNEYTYNVPQGQKQMLSVCLRLESNGSYQILQWETQSNETWTADETIELWDGEMQ